MNISPATIDRAFEAFRNRYVEKATRAWDLDHHGKLWALARADVESLDGVAGFSATLNELRSHWQIARGKGSKMMDSEKVLPLLRQKATRAFGKRLSEIDETDSKWLFQLIEDVSDIKRINGQPSLMAISKVLHFFNPRLFVIVDRAMVWDWVFMHPWIWKPVEAVRQRVDILVGCDPEERSHAACDIASYVAVLVSCGELVRTNPQISTRFGVFLNSHTSDEANIPDDIEGYQAAAVEWLLLGLVELPPAGVTL